MSKIRINWTIEPDCINLLQQAKKLNPRKVTYSNLVEYAIRQTYQNKLKYYRKKMKEHQKELMRLNDIVLELEKNTK